MFLMDEVALQPAMKCITIVYGLSDGKGACYPMLVMGVKRGKWSTQIAIRCLQTAQT